MPTGWHILATATPGNFWAQVIHHPGVQSAAAIMLLCTATAIALAMMLRRLHTPPRRTASRRVGTAHPHGRGCAKTIDAPDVNGASDVRTASDRQCRRGVGRAHPTGILHPRNPVGAIHRDTRGTATIEFALLFPILLFFVLLLAQTTMLMAGHVVVHYSAFAATRVAIVQIPRDIDGDGPNVYTHREGRHKHDRIHAAAVYGVLPVAGRGGSGDAGSAAGDFAGAFSDFYAGYGEDEPPWVQAMLAEKLDYAVANTQTTVLIWRDIGDGGTFEPIGAGSSHAFGPRDPITVRVSHRLNLGVPYVSRIYADARDNPTGDDPYTLLRAQYTLTNEGVRDELPPPPALPRTTP